MASYNKRDTYFYPGGFYNDHVIIMDLVLRSENPDLYTHGVVRRQIDYHSNLYHEYNLKFHRKVIL